MEHFDLLLIDIQKDFHAGESFCENPECKKVLPIAKLNCPVCNTPVQNPTKDEDGSLAVPNALEDATRVVEMIRKFTDYNGKCRINSITVTLDTHEVLDIGHSPFWVRDRTVDLGQEYWCRQPPDLDEKEAWSDEQNFKDPRCRVKDDNLSSYKYLFDDKDDTKEKKDEKYIQEYGDPDFVPPFTSMQRVTVQRKREGESGKGRSEGEPPSGTAFLGTTSRFDGKPSPKWFWRPYDFAYRVYCMKYLDELADGANKFDHMVWPTHCLEGSEGHGIVALYADALAEWSAKTGIDVNYVYKGTNPLCEMYSAIKAEVAVEGDLSTYANTKLVKDLRTKTLDPKSVGLVVGGQAMSHCVRYTVEDLVAYWNFDQTIGPSQTHKLNPDEHEAYEQDEQARASLITEYGLYDTKKIYLLEDGASAVPGFDTTGFLKTIAGNVKLKSCKDVTDELTKAFGK